MSKAIIIEYNLYGDTQRLINEYSLELESVVFMIEKLKSNSYKSDNTAEIMSYSLKKDALEFSISRLKEIIYY